MGAQRSPDVVWTVRRFLTVWEDSREEPFRILGTRSEPPFELRAKVIRHDTRVDD